MSHHHLHVYPGRRGGRNTPTLEHPIAGVAQFPLLQPPYIAVLPSRDAEGSRRFGDERGHGNTRTKDGMRNSLEIPLPDGWNYYIHPKGWVYYYNPTSRSVTDYRMEYRLGQQEFDHALKHLEVYPVERIPPNCEIWVDYKLQNEGRTPEKLFVDHTRRFASVGSTWQDEEIDVRQRTLLRRSTYGKAIRKARDEAWEGIEKSVSWNQDIQ